MPARIFRRRRSLKALIPRVLEVMHRQVDLMLEEDAGPDRGIIPKDQQPQASPPINPRTRRRR